MEQRQVECSERQEEEAASISPFRLLLTQISGPLIIALILAGMGGIFAGWRNDLLFTERLGVISSKVIILEQEASKGHRFTASDASEIQRKYEGLQAGLTELRVLVAGMLAQNNRKR